MALFSWARGLFGTGAGQRRPGVQTGEAAAYAGESPATVNQNTALGLSAVWACTRLIAESVASMPLHFYRLEKDKSETPLPDHPLATLFDGRVNAWQSRNEFFESLVAQLALLGNAYALKQRNSAGQIIGLLPLMSEQMEVSLQNDGMQRAFRYHTGVTVRAFTDEEIWHNRLFGNGVIGLNPLSFARNSVGIGLATEKRVGKIMSNGAKPAGILKTGSAQLSPDQRARTKESFRDLAEGNNDTLFVLEGGFDYQQISMSPKDIELISSRRFQIEDIARFFGVPSVLINDTSASTTWGSGIEQIVEGFYKLGLRPYIERLESSINLNLISFEDRQRGVKCAFDFNALLRGNMKFRFETYKAAVSGGFMTPNEARAKEGWSAKDGGDQLFMQAQMVPVAMLANGEGLKNTSTGRRADDAA